ncbi:UNVERIFIED_CONTAM: hypothetical protein Sindi_0064800 [Sesamum indicum]
MVEGSSILEHGVMMLPLVKKLKDIRADFEREEMYIDYEATNRKPTLLVLVGEASISKVKGKDAERGKRKKNEIAASSSSPPVAPLGGDKGKRKKVQQSRVPNDVYIYCRERRATGRGGAISSSLMKVNL